MTAPICRHVTGAEERAACLAIRRVVFIEGQSVPEDLEIDGLDDTALHFLTTIDGQPVATARVRLISNDEGKQDAQKIAKIERVAVLEQHRGKALGKHLMMFILEHIRTTPSISMAKLGSQEHAIPFYEKLGFTRLNTPYMDAGIPHDDMVLRFNAPESGP